MDRKTLTSLFLLVTISLSWAHKLGSSDDGSPVLTRNKRNLVQFLNVINCATGRSGWDYNGYGCHCGFGGEGTPVDDTDRCCEAHDKCYDDALSWFCIPYLSTYSYSCDTSGSTPTAICDSISNSNCQQKTCKCDKEAADCFAAAALDFDDKYIDYDKDNCY